MAIGEELTFEELKSYICDDKNPVGTDELLSLLSEFIGDDDISKVIDQHIKGLDIHWRWTIRVNEAIEQIHAVNSQINTILKKVGTDD